VEQHDGQTESQKDHLGGLGPPSSRFSRDERLAIGTSYYERQVALSELFDQREIRSSVTIIPRRILIRGRAGIGKTTLCKKIVHDFTHERMWEKLFDRVLWIPLRKLKDWEGPYNMKRLFCHVYWGDSDDDLLAEALRKHVEGPGSSRTLFLLDGLDEVTEIATESLNGNNHRALRLLIELLNKPNVIITARPHVSLPFESHKTDVELETIGFTPDQMDRYIEKFTQDPRDVEDMRLYLRRNRIVQSLMRIPVQLDAFCFTWKGYNSGTIPETMTAVYESITTKLWYKDLERLEKRDGRPATQLFPAELEKVMSHESQILESLAFSCLFNNMVEFQSSHLERLYMDLERPYEGKMAFQEMLNRLSFLRTSDPSVEQSKRTYHFIHLTFQEYFAARYFVRKWESPQNLQNLQ
jgi:hypothetical protein